MWFDGSSRRLKWNSYGKIYVERTNHSNARNFAEQLDCRTIGQQILQMQSIFPLWLLVWESSICCWVMVSNQWTNFTLIYDRPQTRVSNSVIKFEVEKTPVVQMKQKIKSLVSMHSICSTAESFLIHLQRWTQRQGKSSELHDHCTGSSGYSPKKNRDFKIWLNISLSILILSSQEESFMNHLIIIYESLVNINTVVMLFHRAEYNLSGYYAYACTLGIHNRSTTCLDVRLPLKNPSWTKKFSMEVFVGNAIDFKGHTRRSCYVQPHCSLNHFCTGRAIQEVLML